MLYVFQAGSEYVKLRIDRIEKKLEIATSKTNYRFYPQAYWKLYGDKAGDKEEALKEMAEMELASDEEFEKKLIASFNKVGYKLVKKSD